MMRISFYFWWEKGWVRVIGSKCGKAIQFRICLLGQEFGCKEFVRDGQSRAIGGISFAGQSGPKRARRPRNLHIRTSSLNGQSLGIGGINFVGQSGSETRLQSQKSTCKDLKAKWPKPSHLGLRPLTLRFLSAPAHAL
ncbi:hypothetical protein AAW28_11515 [Lacticaseibacillus casei]|nr:hypothetical protein AAW28_11515 [Lacticaseibacillus casei]